MVMSHSNDTLLAVYTTLAGRGRFGQVWKAKAVGIVPSDPGRNVVAVKTINCKQQEPHVMHTHTAQ